MRMWNIPVELLCQKHLCGEHVEMHMFVGSINKGVSLQGYINNGLIDTKLIKQRHDALAEEMLRRGYNHKSPLEQPEVEEVWSVDVVHNFKDLMDRCPECAKRITEAALKNDGVYHLPAQVHPIELSIEFG